MDKEIASGYIESVLAGLVILVFLFLLDCILDDMDVLKADNALILKQLDVTILQNQLLILQGKEPLKKDES